MAMTSLSRYATEAAASFPSTVIIRDWAIASSDDCSQTDCDRFGAAP